MSTTIAEDSTRWVDLPSAVALTGVRRYVVVLAIVDGIVRWSTDRLGHEKSLMVALDDVEALATLAPQNVNRSQPG